MALDGPLGDAEVVALVGARRALQPHEQVGGILEGLNPGTIVADCSTAEPDSTLRMAIPAGPRSCVGRLAASSTYLEVAYLLRTGELPAQGEYELTFQLLLERQADGSYALTTDLLRLIDRLDPDNRPGRLILIEISREDIETLARGVRQRETSQEQVRFGVARLFRVRRHAGDSQALLGTPAEVEIFTAVQRWLK